MSSKKDVRLEDKNSNGNVFTDENSFYLLFLHPTPFCCVINIYIFFFTNSNFLTEDSVKPGERRLEASDEKIALGELDTGKR